MPVVAGPTPVRCALKSNRCQSPFTAAVEARRPGRAVVVVALVVLVVLAAVELDFDFDAPTA